MSIEEAEIEKQFTGMQQARQPITKRRQLSISHAEGYAANQKAGAVVSQWNGVYGSQSESRTAAGECRSIQTKRYISKHIIHRIHH